MEMSEEFIDYLIGWSKRWHSRGAGVGDVILKVTEEAGEAAEAYLVLVGFKDKGTQTSYGVAKELADVIVAAMVAITTLGWNPADLLEENMVYNKERFPDAFA